MTSLTHFDFVREAKTAIEDNTARGKLPIIAGGTGLTSKVCLKLSSRWWSSAKRFWPIALNWTRYRMKTCTKECGARLVISLQLNRSSGQWLWNCAFLGRTSQTKRPIMEPHSICLDDERSLIYERINAWADRMLRKDCWMKLVALWWPSEAQAQGIGYKELFSSFCGRKQSLEEA